MVREIKGQTRVDTRRYSGNTAYPNFSNFEFSELYQTATRSGPRNGGECAVELIQGFIQ